MYGKSHHNIVKKLASHFCCSVAQSCLTLCNPMNCSTPGFPVLHYLPEFAQTHVHWVSDAIQPSQSSVTSFSFCLQFFLASDSFPMSKLLTSGGQSIGASASVFPMNIQCLFPLELSDLAVQVIFKSPLAPQFESINS